MAKAKEQPTVYEQHSFKEDGGWQIPRRLYTPDDVERLQEALEPFVDIPALRRLVAEQQSVYEALRTDRPPREVQGLIDTLVSILRPTQREQIRAPRDVAALLMVEMGNLDQEELRTVLLDTKNRVQAIATVYKGSVNSISIRVGEVYKEALRRNSVAIVVAHNHPSGDCEPSPEDVLITKKIVEAGRLLDVDCLDHIIVSRSTWVSLKERGDGVFLI